MICSPREADVPKGEKKGMWFTWLNILIKDLIGITLPLILQQPPSPHPHLINRATFSFTAHKESQVWKRELYPLPHPDPTMWLKPQWDSWALGAGWGLSSVWSINIPPPTHTHTQRGCRVCISQAQAQILALPFTGSDLGQILNLFQPQFPHL